MSNREPDCKDLVKFEISDLENALVNFCKEISCSTDDIFIAFNVVLTPLLLWNPLLGIVLQAFVSIAKIGVNSLSRKKAEKNLLLFSNSLLKILRQQKTGETNYEAALVCPDLIRGLLIIEDEDRVREHLYFIEAIFRSGKMDFDDLAEALRLINQLSSTEYKILKLVPVDNAYWKDMFKIKEFRNLYETQEERLTAALLSLINMNLIVKKLGIKHDGGPELGTINFNNEREYIRLSAYGQLFLNTLEEVKAKKAIDLAPKTL